MDMVDILGSLLGHKSSRGGKGSDALNDMIKRGSQSSRQKSEPTDINREAKELEDILNVANDRRSAPSRGTASSRETAAPRSSPTTAPAGRSANKTDEQALILIRAMINAAKADGRLDQEEQDNILKQMHSPNAESVQFMREEFQRPLDVRGFALTVPVGMEQQVYTMSLIAIDLDTGDEAKYLMELAENLRLPSDVREKIHQQLGAPRLY